MLLKKLKETLRQETERVYDATKNKEVDAWVNIGPKISHGVKVKRATRQNIKWRSKNY
ncbi:hypothetical protein [Enterococcus nangangensis]|uniref:hypothetical protein n=1 Tax=Enterococcus nangangensis TaxID=2559926 RepID=UPI001485BB11|nr:hypothetical protein [Enterococcus nangangensis]